MANRCRRNFDPRKVIDQVFFVEWKAKRRETPRKQTQHWQETGSWEQAERNRSGSEYGDCWETERKWQRVWWTGRREKGRKTKTEHWEGTKIDFATIADFPRLIKKLWQRKSDLTFNVLITSSLPSSQPMNLLMKRIDEGNWARVASDFGFYFFFLI